MSSMQVEDPPQQPQARSRKRKDILSPELKEVLHMLKALETKPAQG